MNCPNCETSLLNENYCCNNCYGNYSNFFQNHRKKKVLKKKKEIRAQEYILTKYIVDVHEWEEEEDEDENIENGSNQSFSVNNNQYNQNNCVKCGCDMRLFSLPQNCPRVCFGCGNGII